MSERIGEEVFEHTPERAWMTADEALGIIELDIDDAPRVEPLRRSERALDQLAKRDRLIAGERVRAEAGKIEQLFSELSQLAGGILCRGEGLFIFFCAPWPSEREADLAREQAEGRAKLVRCVRDEAALRIK